MKDKTVLITGGTGSLGQALTTELLGLGAKVIIFSRDEYKQAKMKRRFHNVNLSFEVGDVRDGKRVSEVMRNVNYVVHTAAIKHVPVAEENPFEAIKTNILGTSNVVYAAKKAGVEKCILTSTDKACHPTNMYGATKLVGEKLFVAANKGSKTVFACTRYGNVIGSRGSVIETLIEENPQSIDITDPKMSRFWLPMADAVLLVMIALRSAKAGEIFIPKVPAMNVVDMFRALNPNIKITVSGMRPGEKLHESLISEDEMAHTEEKEGYYIIKPELFGVEYQDNHSEYTSANAEQIGKEEFIKLCRNE